MSVSPLQNLVNPPPVPEVPTVTSTPGCSLRNSSVMASEMGATVEDPSTTILPERADPPPELPPASSSPPHAAATRASASVRPSSQPRRRIRSVIPVFLLRFVITGATVRAVADAPDDGR